MATAHQFEARLSWHGGEGVAWGNHRVELAGRPPLGIEVGLRPGEADVRVEQLLLEPRRALLPARQ